MNNLFCHLKYLPSTVRDSGIIATGVTIAGLGTYRYSTTQQKIEVLPVVTFDGCGDRSLRHISVCKLRDMREVMHANYH